MLELKLIFFCLLAGIIFGVFYEPLRFLKTKRLFFWSGIILDFCVYFIGINILYARLVAFALCDYFVHSLLFCALGFCVEKASFNFLFDKAFNFVYTKSKLICKRFRQSRVGEKFFKWGGTYEKDNKSNNRLCNIGTSCCLRNFVLSIINNHPPQKNN